MGCVVSKKTAPATPVVESTGASGSLELSGGILNPALWNRIEVDRSESRDSGKLSYGTYSLSFRLGNFHKQVEGEQVAAAWPSWLSGVTREAIYGEGQQAKPTFREDPHFSAPLPAAPCSDFKRAKKQKENRVSTTVHHKYRSKCDAPRVLESSNVLQFRKSINSNRHGSGDKFGFDSTCKNQDEISKDLMVHQWVLLGHPEPYEVYNCKRDEQSFMHCNLVYMIHAVCLHLYSQHTANDIL
ncbi:cyclin-dependent kinase 12/13 [Apostasia shenzhenica]|uniref:Cyclin-dependent kinase 12/13 n=1 Tax=Apostasia shenzhenica TaxID=1088818 RepID=A0A2I0APD7_9ASPA|nr:cyclin-dependent kinase 12/13 [Apostasia shenzhenica]